MIVLMELMKWITTYLCTYGLRLVLVKAWISTWILASWIQDSGLLTLESQIT